jgi:hypothetical protein
MEAQPALLQGRPRVVGATEICAVASTSRSEIRGLACRTTREFDTGAVHLEKLVCLFLTLTLLCM